MQVLIEEQNYQANLDPVLLGQAKSATLTDSAGNELPAQLTQPCLFYRPASPNAAVARQLHFILPSLKKGESLKLTAMVSDDAPAGEGFAFKDTPGEYTELSFGCRPVLRYMCAALDESTPDERERTYKVFHHLYDPCGNRFMTKGPGGKYTHHRGLFFGFNRISYGDDVKVDIWHCKNDTHQSHEGSLAEESGPVLGRHTVAVDWHGEGSAVFASENRQMTVYNVPGGQMIEFASRLSSKVGKVKLDGDPQHAGFQFRAAQEVADGDQQLTYYLRPDGKGLPGETRNWTKAKGGSQCVNLPFDAMCFVLDGKRYTAVYIDKPTNPKEARYSERTYGRFGSYFEYELDEDKELELNYRLWLQEGEMTVDQAAALSDDFVDPPKVTVN